MEKKREAEKQVKKTTRTSYRRLELGKWHVDKKKEMHINTLVVELAS